MRATIFALNIVAALAAIIAAVFWFLSAAGKLPPMVTYWDSTPSTDPLYQALQNGVRMNRIAAIFCGPFGALDGGGDLLTGV